MSDVKTYPVPADFAAKAHINEQQYHAMYQASINDPDQFWAQQAEEHLNWEQRWSAVCEFDFKAGQAAWFIDGTILPQ